MSTAGPSILELNGITRHFGGVPAVDGVSIRVQRGSITGLIGPNGAGKTTVVNMVMGLLHVSAGRILLDGQDITMLEAPELARAGIARTFQNIRLVPHATVLENILSGFHTHETTGLWSNILGLGPARAETARLRERARELLELFEMEKFAESRAGNLSYGHQRKVEMMRALATSPRLLLLDEPVAGMNDTEASNLANIFRKISSDGVSVLLIEHNMRFVRALCSTLFVMASGRLIAQGDVESVLGNPAVMQAYLGEAA